MTLYDKIFPPQVITLPDGKSVRRPRSRMPIVVAVLAVMAVLSVKVTGFDFALLCSRIREFFVILGQMFSAPAWNYLPQVWKPLFDTVKMSLL